VKADHGFGRYRSKLPSIAVLTLVILFWAAVPRIVFSEQVTLAWDPNSETDLAGYRVYYGTSSGLYPNVTDVGNMTTATISNLTAGQTYYFSATAYDTQGRESGYSNEVSSRPRGPGTTYTVTASAGSNGSISPSGTVSVNQGGSQSFAVTPRSGYHAADVLVDGKSVGAVAGYTFSNVTANHTISASFEQDDPNKDSDADGIPDQWELAHGLDPYVEDAAQDPDGDGITNLYEYLGGTDPHRFDANQAPDAPVLVFPADDDLVSLAPALQTAAFYDPDSGDTHGATEWKIVRDSDGVCVLDLKSPTALTAITVPELILEQQTDYAWQARFFDNHGAASDWSTTGYFTTTQNLVDLNGDGIPDSLQPDVTADVNGDGIFDVDQISLRSIRIKGKATLLGIDTKDSPTVLKVAYLQSINPADPGVLADTAAIPGPLPFGLINFKVLVKNPGDQAELTVYFSETVPANSSWYKYDPVEETWQDFCDYVDISPSGKYLTLYLVDGGPGDADGIANGVIVDPSGPVAPASTTDPAGNDGGGSAPSTTASSSGGGGAGGCFVSSAGQSLSTFWEEIRGPALPALMF
jgi:chitinase